MYYLTQPICLGRIGFSSQRIIIGLLNSNCFLFNLDDLEDDEEIPQFAIENNLDLVLSIAEVQTIVDNAHQQRPHCSELDLFKAFLYYFEHDAFLTFSE